MTKQRLILACAAVLCLPLILVGCDGGAEERAELDKVKGELEELKASSRKTSSERDDLKRELAAVTKTRDELQGQVTRLSGEEKKLRNQIGGLTGSSQTLDSKVTALTGSVDQLAGQLKEVTDSRDQLQRDIAELKSSRDGLQAQVEELTKQRDEAVAKERQAQREIAALAGKSQVGTETSSEPQDGLVAVNETPKGEGSPKVEPAASPTIHSFGAARTKISKGQNTTLSWHVSNADRISIEPDVGSVSALGSTNVKPPKTATYTLTATNAAGETIEARTIRVR